MNKSSRPYIAEILEHDGKKAILPIPSKLRELESCIKVLGIKDRDDEDDLFVVGYRTVYLPEPDVNTDTKNEVERTAEALSKLNEEQVRAIGVLCRLFYLRFNGIMALLDLINNKAKEDDYFENL